MAPNKKYLSLEEAAVQLGIPTDELIRLREKGDVRGFADRGTWKFKADDVAEFRRRRQPDSDPDLQIMDDADDDEDLGRQATVIRHGSSPKSDSDVRVLSQDDSKRRNSAATGDKVSASNLQNSDSDVRLIEPVRGTKKGSDSDVTLIKTKMVSADSDSDVKIVDLPRASQDSDSDVKLLDHPKSMFDSDSDVALTSSDSDVRLAPLIESDSDVKLMSGKSLNSDSDVTLLPQDSKLGPAKGGTARGRDSAVIGSQSRDVDFDLGDSDGDESVLDGDDSSISLGGESGIRFAGDSGIQLAGDSGIRLSGLSGIRLGGGSGIRLADDSGVQLKQPTDSGISLEGMDSGIRLGGADSGISLGEDSGINLLAASSSNLLKGKSSKSLKGSSSNLLKGGKGLKADSSSKSAKNSRQAELDDLDATTPMNLSGLSEDDLGTTSPLLDSMESDGSVAELDLFDASDTSEMQTLGDSGQNVVMFDDDDDEEPPVQKKRKQKTVEESIFESDDASEEALEELEVSDDDLSGESELDDMAFDDGDEELDESFTTGASHVGFGAPQKVAVAQEAEWSAGFCTLLMASICILIAGTLVSADLLRTVWTPYEQHKVDQGMAGLLAGFWK